MPATFTVFKVWSSGDILSAADLNSSFTQFINNLDPSGLGSASTTLAAMRNTSNPYPNNVEALASNTLLEIQQLRYMLTVYNGGNYWYTSPGYISAGLVAATSLYDGLSNYRKPSYVSAAYTVVMRGASGAIDQGSITGGIGSLSNANATSSTPTTSISGIAVTNGDILLVQSQTAWTAGASELETVNIGFTGVTAAFLYATISVQVALKFDAVSTHAYNIPLFAVLFITQTGNLTLQSILTATSPTSINNSIGYGFLKKQ